MTEGDELLPSELLRRLALDRAELSGFNRADTEATLAKVRRLSAAAVYFNSVAVRDFGGRLGPVRERGLAEQVVGAAFQTYEGVDPHPGQYEKAAMLLRGITQGHPFNDGNKRTGFLIAAYYLDLAGYPLPEELPADEVVGLCVRVSAGELRDVGRIAEELERLWAGDPLESKSS